MKSTLVPAQITTIEDKIAGNLSVQQLLLLSAPIFICGAIYGFIPPFFALTPFKVSLSLILFVVCAVLAIRIRTTLVIEWFIVMIRYNVRPRYYVYNKRSPYLRDTGVTVAVEPLPGVLKDQVSQNVATSVVSASERVRITEILGDPRARFNLTSRKGKLHVHITEIK